MTAGGSLTTQRSVVGVLAVAGALGACRAEPATVTVHLGHEGAPVAGAEITALPYDPARLLDSLAAEFPERRPAYDDLVTELLAFELPPPDTSHGNDSLERAWQATRDSVARLADSLLTTDRRAPGYGVAYRGFRTLYGRLLQRGAAREAARRGGLRPVRELAQRAARAADSVRAWEDRAFLDLPAAAAAAVARTGRSPAAATTGPEGTAELRLPPGPWWLVARLRHPTNPFAEYVWTVPFHAGPFPVNVPLTGDHARLAWRH